MFVELFVKTAILVKTPFKMAICAIFIRKEDKKERNTVHCKPFKRIIYV